jgi:hypothetical protein
MQKVRSSEQLLPIVSLRKWHTRCPLGDATIALIVSRDVL